MHWWHLLGLRLWRLLMRTWRRCTVSLKKKMDNYLHFIDCTKNRILLIRLHCIICVHVSLGDTSTWFHILYLLKLIRKKNNWNFKSILQKHLVRLDESKLKRSKLPWKLPVGFVVKSRSYQMAMTLACDTYFQLYEMIVVLVAVVFVPNDSHVRLTFPKKSVEHAIYEVVEPDDLAAVALLPIVNVVKH